MHKSIAISFMIMSAMNSVAQAAEPVSITLDKGAIEVDVSSAAAEPFSFSYKMPEGCMASLQVNRTLGKLEMLHSKDPCSSGAKVKLTLSPNYTFNIQVRTGLINVASAKKVAANFSRVTADVRTGTINSYTFEGANLTRSKDYSGAQLDYTGSKNNQPSLSLDVSAGLINFY